MEKTLIDKVNNKNFAVLNSMDDWVRIVDLQAKTIFVNNSLDLARKKSESLSIYLDENIPLNLASENDSIRNTTVIEEKLINDRYYSIKASPIVIDGDYSGVVEVFRDITRETNMKIDLFDANRNMLDDVRFVRKVQSSILPKNKIYGKLDLKSYYNPSSNVSGDMFDLIKLDDNRYAFYIADVMGHGVKASILTMFVKVSISSIFDKYPDYTPSQALLKLRSRFYDLDIDSSQYFTAWLGIFDMENNTLCFSNAGHNCPPMIFKSNIEACEYLHASGRMISNIIEPDVYNEVTTELKDGDLILFFTDGVIEATDENNKEFGLTRLKEVFCQHRQIDKIYDEIEDFSWGEQKDDITLAMITYRRDNAVK